MSTTPLSVLDLIPRSSGDSTTTAVRNLVDLARQTEHIGYHRYWFAEHHLNPGVLGASPAVSIALVAAATSTIRLGSAGVQLGHHQPLAIVEEFGLLDAACPGRLDLGLGRSIGRPKPAPETNGSAVPAAVHAYAVVTRDAVGDRLSRGRGGAQESRVGGEDPPVQPVQPGTRVDTEFLARPRRRPRVRPW